MALGFLFTSGWYAYTTGTPLSAAPVVPSIVMFLIYSGSLAFPSFGKIGWYRVAMAIAIVPFGVGGVLLNILNYAQNGLRDFKSFEVWCIAIGINGFGTVWNIVAAAGIFARPCKRNYPNEQKLATMSEAIYRTPSSKRARKER